MKNRFESFRDFYPFYLSQHTRPLTRALHVLGLAVALYCLAYVLWTGRWLGLIAVPVAGYGPAWIGHFFFEKNRPATFQYPFYSLMGDFVMFGETLTRRRWLGALFLTMLSWPLVAETPESRPAETAASASVRFVITNQGADVEGKGTYSIFPIGEHQKELGYAYSGAEAHIPSGTYDVLVRYRDDAVNKEIWLENRKLEGQVSETVELDLKLAEVRYTLINNGVPAGNKGRFTLYTPGKKPKEVASAPSGTSIKVNEGVYDVLLRFEDETSQAKKEKWQRKVKMEARVDKTVAFDVLGETLPAETQAASRGTALGSPSDAVDAIATAREGGQPTTMPAETRPIETRPAETRPAETRPAPQAQPTTQPTTMPTAPSPPPPPPPPVPVMDHSVPQTVLPPPPKEGKEESGWGCGLR